MKRLIRFSLTGVAGTLLDFAVFTMALGFTGNSAISRALGYACGTIWAFLINRSWVFNSTSGLSRLFPFLLLYFTTGTIAVAIQASFELVAMPRFGVFVAYGLSLTVASTINFLGMRYLVFKQAGAKPN